MNASWIINDLQNASPTSSFDNLLNHVSKADETRLRTDRMRLKVISKRWILQSNGLTRLLII